MEGGGAQRDAVLMANAIARTGRSVAIMTLRPDGYLRDIVEANVKLIPVHGHHLRSAVTGLARALLEHEPRVLVSAEAAPNTVAVLASRLLARPRRPKLVVREAAVPSLARRCDPYIQNRLAYRAVRWTYPLADLVLTLTAGARDDLIRNFGVPAERVKVLPANAVIDEAYPLPAAVPREPGLIVSLGRLSPEKDFATLIKAAALLPSASPVRIEIAGDGPEHGALSGLIRELGVNDRVRLVGRIAEPFVLLRRASLAVCASRYEGFGNAVVEALACGTPVVSTDCPYGPREILDHGRFGVLVPVGDPRALAEAMVQSVDAPVNRPALQARASVHTLTRAANAFLMFADRL
jgi:glycosyltransferase involved in cell wall biosynthesis